MKIIHNEKNNENNEKNKVALVVRGGKASPSLSVYNCLRFSGGETKA